VSDAKAKKWSHRHGHIRQLQGGLRAELSWAGRRYLSRVESVEAGRGWIDRQLHLLGAEARDFTAAEVVEIRLAMAALPEGVTLLQAAHAYSATHKALTPATIDQAKEAYLRQRETEGLRPRTLQGIRWGLGYLPKDGEWPSHAWMLERLPDHPTTRGNVIRILVVFFAWCISRHYLADSPLAGIGKPVVDEHAPEILTVPQARALLAASSELHPRLVPYFAIGLFAGLRSSELDALRWADVSIDTITVRSEVAKSRRARYVPICANLLAWLAPHRGDPQDPVSWWGWKQLAEKVRECRVKADLAEWPRNAMRHSFGSYHLALHENWSQTAFLMGHSGGIDVLAQHYRQLVTQDQAREYFGLTPGPR
jgi:integrase